MLNTKRMRFPIDVILVCIRWYAAYPLSYRQLEELMLERGVQVDHSSIKSLGDSIPASFGESVSKLQTPGGLQLAHG